ncbi:MAG: DUF2339 domain-containing protein [Magnetovibrio sp.]|nr:DUF2339 domain-containing protein [Magnetovibrio sp.]
MSSLSIIVMVLGAVAYWFVMPALAFVSASRAEKALIAMKKKVVALEHRLATQSPLPSNSKDTAITEPVAEPEKPKPTVAQQSAPPRPQVSKPVHTPQPTKTENEPSIFKGWERKIGANWSVWAGALALAVGAILLVKYMVDAGVLSPMVRTGLGVMSGLVLIGLGEVLSRRGWSKPIAGISIASVPEAIAAAGVGTIYGSIYVAHGFYDLMSANVTFGVLALVSVGAIALSLRHGILLAVVGLTGAYVVPALIGSDHPSALGLFGYLTLITAVCHGVVWSRDWTHLSMLAVGASAVWTGLWFGFTPRAIATEAGYFAIVYTLYVMVGGYMVARSERSQSVVWTTPESWTWVSITVTWHTLMGLISGLVLVSSILAQVRLSGYDLVSVLVGSFALISMIALARWDERLMALVVLALMNAAGLIVVWGSSVDNFKIIADYAELPVGGSIAIRVLGIAIAAWIITGISARWMVRWPMALPGLWTACVAVAPVVMIAAIFGRDYVLNQSGPWLWWALAASVVNAVLAVVTYRRKNDENGSEDFVAYTFGALFALCLAAAMQHNEVWLNVALALSLGATAAMGMRLKLASMVLISVGISLAVMLRLLMDPFPLNDLRHDWFDVLWVVPTYALPATMMVLASRWLREIAHEYVIIVFDVGALAFSVVMVTAASRMTMAVEIDSRSLSYFDIAVQTSTWLGMAYALYKGDKIETNVRGFKITWVTYVWGLMAGSSLFIAVMGPGVSFGVMGYYGRILVGETPFFNLLFIAYFVPGLITMMFSRTARERGHKTIQLAFGGLSLMFLFIYVNMSVRHLFHGTNLFSGYTTDAEVYSYSMAWIVFAGAVMVYGMVRKLAILRKLALGLIAVTAFKVFVFDMGTLEGLYRALSFLGLGAALIALGFAYQRMVRLESA